MSSAPAAFVHVEQAPPGVRCTAEDLFRRQCRSEAEWHVTACDEGSYEVESADACNAHLPTFMEETLLDGG